MEDGKLKGFYCSPREKLSLDYMTPNIDEISNLPTSTSKPPMNPEIVCNFCKQNGEPSEIFLSHNLKIDGKVTCPVLRNYKCVLCGATGDNAHTRSYCPLKSQFEDDEILGAGYFTNMASLKKSEYNAAGQKRKF